MSEPTNKSISVISLALSAHGIADPKSLVSKFVGRGVMLKPNRIEPDAAALRRQASQRICMARLREERRGHPTDHFPKRQRNRFDKTSLSVL